MLKKSILILLLTNIFLFSCNVSTKDNSIKKPVIEKKIAYQKELNKEKIKKKTDTVKKVKLLPSNKKLSSENSVTFEFKTERLLHGFEEKQYQKNLKIAEKAIEATFKMLTRSPSTGMESISLSKKFESYKPVNYDFVNYFYHLQTHVEKKIEKTILIFLPFSGLYKEFGNKLRKSLELGLLESKNSNIKYLYFDSGNKFSEKNLFEFIKKHKPSFVLGPLLRENLIKLKPIVKQFEIPIISFTNDKNLAEENVWVTGFSPEDQIEKMINYSSKCNKKNYGFIGSEDEYGNIALKKINEKINENQLIKHLLIDNHTILNKERLKRLLKNFLEYKDEEVLNLNKKLVFDAIFIVGDTNFVLEIMPILTYYDLDLKNTDILGTSIFNDQLLLNEHSLLNAKFPKIEEFNKDKFKTKWKSMWLEEPDELNRLGYDISKISIWVINQEKKFVELIKENYNKFSIMGNKFKFFTDGSIHRPSEIFKINPTGKTNKINNCS